MAKFESVSEVLDAAHDELLMHGWCQFNMERKSGELCSLGAISSALGLRHERDNDLVYPWFNEHGQEATIALAAVIDRTELERFRLGPVTTKRLGWDSLLVQEWNDDDDRTMDDVLDAMRRASKAVREAAS